MYDLIIIGGGAAAFAAATKANDLGAKALMFNEGLPLGGTCVNVGCVPSKHLLGVAEALHAARTSHFTAVQPKGAGFSLRDAIAEKDELVAGLRHQNYHRVLDALETVEFRQARARLAGEGRVEAGGELIEGKHVLVATGARAAAPPIPGLQEAGYLTNIEALDLTELPERLAIIGGGPLGLEFAQVFARFGARVTVIEMEHHIVPRTEPEIAAVLQQALENDGITILTNTMVREVKAGSPKIVVAGDETIEADSILVATGIRANTDGLRIEMANGSLNPAGFVQADKYYQVAPRLWAAGDVLGRMPLETVAAKEGALAAGNALDGRRDSLDYDAVPWAVFTSPQLAGVGFTEDASMERTNYCNCRTVYYTQVPKAMALKDQLGAVKLTVDREDRIRGAHAVGTNAAEIIHEAALAISQGMTVHDIINTVHVFPTYSEAMKLAAQAFTRDISVMTCCIG
ncbi:MAG: mercury(II) reductase [Dehalococcoidia bacterium]